jgi:CBS domain containing-hemolysin-like protein
VRGDAILSALALVLVLLSAGFACLEAALSRISPPLAASLLEDEQRGAKRLVALIADRARPLNLLLLLRTVTEVAAIAAVAVVVVHSRGEGYASLGIATAIMTLVSYALIGVAARTIGQQHARRIALATAPLVTAITGVFGPLPRLLIAIANAFTPGRGYREGPFATEAELRALVELAEQRGEVDARERQLIDSALDLGDTIVREVMVPRPDILFVERGRTVRQALNLALRSGFSRIPVIGESADDLIGIVYLKDLARRVMSGSRATAHVEDVMRPASFVPDSKPVDELLREMQLGRIHIAIVVDEYGGTAGLVTIEDILEEIVGEIADEYDREQSPVEQVSAGRWRVTARLPVDELGELVGIDLERDGVDTVGGLLAHELGRVAIPGASAQVEGIRLEAESAKGRRNRIGTVLVTAPNAGALTEDDPADVAEGAHS